MNMLKITPLNGGVDGLIYLSLIFSYLWYYFFLVVSEITCSIYCTCVMYIWFILTLFNVLTYLFRLIFHYNRNTQSASFYVI